MIHAIAMDEKDRACLKSGEDIETAGDSCNKVH